MRIAAVAVVTAIALALVAACTASGTSSDAGSSAGSVDVAPDGNAPASTPGTAVATCALPEAGTRTIDVGGVERTFDVFPPTGALDGPVPTLVLFHGFNSSKEQMETTTGLAEQAAAAGVLLVVPQGAGTPSGWSSLAGFDADDAFLTAALAEVRAEPCVADGPLWLAGFSAGSAFSGVFGCRHATEVTGIVMVSGLPPAICPPETTPTILIAHGTADPVVPFAGGNQKVGETEVPLASVPDSAAAWATRAGCAAQPETATLGTDVTITRWNGCTGGGSVTLQAIDGGGHAWPGAVQPNLPGTTQTISEACTVLAAIAGSAEPWSDCPGDGPPA